MQSRSYQPPWPLRSIAGAALALLLTAGASSAAEPDGAPFAWTNITAILDRHPSTGPEADLDVAELVGKTVALSLTFVRAEQDENGKARYVYRHTAGKVTVTYFVKGTVADKGSGVFTGRIVRVRFLQSDLRGIRSYAMWFDADTFTPAP
jgi:hypothetical protein